MIDSAYPTLKYGVSANSCLIYTLEVAPPVRSVVGTFVRISNGTFV